MSIVLWIIITVTFMCILCKMSSVIIYCHNQLKSLSLIDFPYVFNNGLRSLIHNVSAISCFCLLLWKFWINNFKVYGVNILMWLFHAMFQDIVSTNMIFYSLCYLTSTFSHITVNANWFRTFGKIIKSW